MTDSEAELVAKYADRKAELHRQLDILAAHRRRCRPIVEMEDRQAVSIQLRRLASELRVLATGTD